MANELALFARDIAKWIPATRNQEIATYALAAVAAAEIVNRAILGRTPAHTTIVDGRVGGALASVKPNGGVIEFDFEFIDTSILTWIWEMLRQHSPIKTGNYRDSHILLADGVEVDPAGVIPQAKIYEFISTVAYAKKIEKGQSSQAPDGVYQVVAQMARRRSNLDISFSYAPRMDAIAPSRKFGRFTSAGQNWTGNQPKITVRGLV